MIFKGVRDGRPYPDHGLSHRQWAQIPPRQIRLDELVTTTTVLALDRLLSEDSTFYGDLFPRANYQNFMARDRELAAFNSYTLGAGASYQFQVPGAPWINKSTANLRVDHLLVNYSDFRNALLAGQYGAGNEPLYKLNANIFQVFVSIWY